MFCDQTFLACDLDRTVLPNGTESQSKKALELFRTFAERQDVILAYLTGRSYESALEAIEEYRLPLPSILVANVGTTIYKKDKWGTYNIDEAWEEMFRQDWKGISGEAISDALASVHVLMPQASENQEKFKRSYYVKHEHIEEALGWAASILDPLLIAYTLVSHEDENIGYVDVIPARATKEHALRYLQEDLYVHKECVLYAGDGGNDLPALTSGYKAVVVQNATDEFKKIVEEEALRRNVVEKVYFAKGKFMGMNGNYSAGILEGLHHFGFSE